MKIEVLGPCNPDGSSHPLWVFDIEAGCDRVLVTMPGFLLDQTEPRVHGFKADKQVEAKLEAHEKCQIIVA